MRTIFLLLSILLLIPSFSVGKAEENESCEELTFTEKKDLLTKIALQNEIPPEVLKTIALFETKMNQCDGKEPIITSDGGIGIMQITKPDFEVNEQKLKSDTAYNIEIGAKILRSKWNMQNNGRIPTINNANPMILENWYFAIMAYNGLSQRNDPNENPGKTYQERFFNELEKYNNIKISDFPDFNVENEDGILTFPDKELQWSDANTLSSQMLKKGDYAFVINANGVSYGNLREEPVVSSPLVERVPFYEKVEILSGPYVESSNDFNYFVMYEVKGDDFAGYTASSNLKPLDFIEHHRSPVSATKEWTIPVKEALKRETINEDTVFIVNDNGEKVASSLTYNRNDSTIKVKPAKPLTAGRSYLLYVANIQNSAGQPMDVPIGMAFTVKNSSENGISVIINNKQQTFRQSPVIENGRTLVPLRGIFEVLGASVRWDSSTRTVTTVKGNANIVLPIGSNTPIVNGSTVTIDTPAKIINESTMVPLRFIGEALGASVSWDGATRTVIIADDKRAVNVIENDYIAQPY